MLITVGFQFLVHVKRLKEKFHLSSLKFLQNRTQAPIHIHTRQTDKCMPGQVMGNRALQSALRQIDVFRIQISDHMNRASGRNTAWIARTGKPEIFVVIPGMIQTDLTRLYLSVHGLHRNQEAGVLRLEIQCPTLLRIPIKSRHTFQHTAFLLKCLCNLMQPVHRNTPVAPLFYLFDCKAPGSQVFSMYTVKGKPIQ